jgi:hypothetical protein
MAPKKRMSAVEAERLLPMMKEFNSVAKIFLALMNQRIDVREKRISLVLSDIPRIPLTNSNISVKMIDIGTTTVKKKKQLEHNQSMDWEKQMRQNQNRGFVI